MTRQEIRVAFKSLSTEDQARLLRQLFDEHTYQASVDLTSPLVIMVRQQIQRVRRCEAKEEGGGSPNWSDAACDLVDAIEALLPFPQ